MKELKNGPKEVGEEPKRGATRRHFLSQPTFVGAGMTFASLLGPVKDDEPKLHSYVT